MLAEEALLERDRERALLAKFLAEQPPWSDLPLLVLTHPGADSPAVLQAMDDLGNVTLLERPLRVAAFVSGVRSALRARQRQYQIRSYLADLQGAAETRALLAAIVTSSNDAIISKTLDGVITTWNVGAERLFEYTAEEAIGRSITMIIPPDRLDEEERILQQLRRGLRIHDYETRARRQDPAASSTSPSASPRCATKAAASSARRRSRATSARGSEPTQR